MVSSYSFFKIFVKPTKYFVVFTLFEKLSINEEILTKVSILSKYISKCCNDGRTNFGGF